MKLRRASSASAEQERPIAEIAVALSGHDDISLSALRGGANSRAYCVRRGDQNVGVLKVYPQDSGPVRSRFQAEQSALQLFGEAGIEMTPRLLGADRDHEAILMTFVDGRPATVDDRAVDNMVDFVARLDRLAGAGRERDLPDAAESCLDDQDILGQIDIRLDRLRNVLSERPELNDFLSNDFDPVLDHYKQRARQVPVGRLAGGERTLSASDFGVHNAIRRADGSLCFIDFEYFGWDDPAKLVCDTLLHPGMAVSGALRQRLHEELLNVFADRAAFAERVEACLPLYALRWCLILLNKFLPAYVAERTGGGSIEEQQARQLEKSRRMLSHAANYLQ